MICVFAQESLVPDMKSWTKVIQDISNAVKYLDDDGMIELLKQVIAMLDNMSDKEFAELRSGEEFLQRTEMIVMICVESVEQVV